MATTIKTVYIANPYSHKSQRVRITRYDQTLQFVQWCNMNFDDAFISVIAMNHPWARDRGELYSKWEVWEVRDKAILSGCDSLFVLCLEGWRESIGVQEEIKFARDNNIEIVYWIKCPSDGVVHTCNEYFEVNENCGLEEYKEPVSEGYQRGE